MIVNVSDHLSSSGKDSIIIFILTFQVISVISVRNESLYGFKFKFLVIFMKKLLMNFAISLLSVGIELFPIKLSG